MDSRSKDVDEARNGTCQWLLEHDTLRRWMNQDCGLLWIKGKPGSGKSTLVKYAKSHLPAHYSADAQVLSFFFHGRGDDLQKSLPGLFRSLLYQLLELVPGAFPDLLNHYEKMEATKGKCWEEWRWHLEDLQLFFKTALHTLLERFPILLIVDALDECGEEAAVELIDFLKYILKSLPLAKARRMSILFSCRHYPILTLEGGLTITLEDENGADIHAYITTKCADPDLTQLISKQAQGVFMWARLVVERVAALMRQGTPQAAIKKEIKHTPRSLEDLYLGLMKDALNRTQTLRLMQWICFSRRPLTTNELRWAMAIPADCDWNSLNECRESIEFVAEDQINNRINTLSCGLAEIVEVFDHSTAKPYRQGSVYTRMSRVQFIHQSVQDFFLEHGFSSLTPDELTVSSAHCKLARSCLHYFRLCVYDHGESFQEVHCTQFPLLEYATESWTFHLVHGQHGETAPEEVLGTLQSASFIDLWVETFRNIHLYHEERPPGGTRLVHVLSTWGCAKLLSCLLLETADVRTLVNLADEYGQTPLSWAAQNGHQEVVKMLLNTSKADVESRDTDGQTPLSRAAKNGHQEVVKMLLDSKADVESRDTDGQTPLSRAAENGHQEVVKMLLDSKADVESRDTISQTPLSLAAKKGHQAVVKLLLATSKANVASRDIGDRTPLLWAAKKGHQDVVKLLLNTGKADVASRDIGNRTPLLWAAKMGHQDVVKLLLATSKADVDSRDEEGRTPLLWAAKDGHQDVVKLLLATGKADVESRDGENRTPLLWAAENGHQDVVKLLLDTSKANVEFRDTCYRQTPLSWAAENGHQEVVKLLLDGKADVESRDTNSRTSLLWAAKNGHEEVVKMLLHTGKADVESRDTDGQTSLLLAAQNGHYEVVKMLLDGTANVESRDTINQTPLLWAAENGHQEVVKMLLDTGKADMEARDIDGQTPLSLAAKKGHQDVVKLLLATGKAGVESRDTKYGQTPLSWGAKHGHNEVVKVLLDTGKADMESRDEHGQTPLSWAARNGHQDVVKMLLGKADVESREDNGRTLLSWATGNGHLDVAKNTT